MDHKKERAGTYEVLVSGLSESRLGVVVTDYFPMAETELELQKGETVEVLRAEGSFWFGRIPILGTHLYRTGTFPLSCVKIDSSLMSKYTSWTISELRERALQLGAPEHEINNAYDKAQLIELVESTEHQSKKPKKEKKEKKEKKAKKVGEKASRVEPQLEQTKRRLQQAEREKEQWRKTAWEKESDQELRLAASAQTAIERTNASARMQVGRAAVMHLRSILKSILKNTSKRAIGRWSKNYKKFRRLTQRWEDGNPTDFLSSPKSSASALQYKSREQMTPTHSSKRSLEPTISHQTTSSGISLPPPVSSGMLTFVPEGSSLHEWCCAVEHYFRELLKEVNAMGSKVDRNLEAARRQPSGDISALEARLKALERRLETAESERGTAALPFRPGDWSSPQSLEGRFLELERRGSNQSSVMTSQSEHYAALEQTMDTKLKEIQQRLASCEQQARRARELGEQQKMSSDVDVHDSLFALSNECKTSHTQLSARITKQTDLIVEQLTGQQKRFYDEQIAVLDSTRQASEMKVTDLQKRIASCEQQNQMTSSVIKRNTTALEELKMTAAEVSCGVKTSFDVHDFSNRLTECTTALARLSSECRSSLSSMTSRLDRQEEAESSMTYKLSSQQTHWQRVEDSMQGLKSEWLHRDRAMLERLENQERMTAKQHTIVERITTHISQRHSSPIRER